MFKGRIVSRSNINGKVHTFQKDFDDYDSYQEFLGSHPEYSQQGIWGSGNPCRVWERLLGNYPLDREVPSVETKYLPEGIDLAKYEKRRIEKREKSHEMAVKRHSLENSKSYLEEYLAENPDDEDAKNDLDKIKKELDENR